MVDLLAQPMFRHVNTVAIATNIHQKVQDSPQPKGRADLGTFLKGAKVSVISSPGTVRVHAQYHVNVN